MTKLVRTQSVALHGIDALPVEIEVNAAGSSGGDQEGFVTIVGLPDAAVRESRERVRSAIYAGGYRMLRDLR